MSASVGQIDRGVYADWKAPSADGELLVWPEPRQLIGGMRENHARLSREESARILGIPLSELRRRTRAWIGALDHDRPIVATGHQTELYHPGVWVKDAVIDAVASAAGAEAYHIAVDTDSPKHLHLRWPGESEPISDDPRITTAAWSALLNAPTPAHLDMVAGKLRSASQSWGFAPAALDVIDSLKRLSLEPLPLSNVICNALHELDWSLGLRHHALLCSPICMSPPFLTFVAHILANARQFAAQYNAALREYRNEHGMKSASRPMPDLFASDQAVEIPFWLDDLSAGTRTRPSVFDAGGRSLLKLVNGDEFEIDPGENAESATARLARFLSGTSHRLSPRALTLTMFLRLLIADQFVHGIGGGLYDQVLDKLIAAHFNVVPPTFAVATATMLLPTALGRQRVCVPCVIAEGRRLRHGMLGERKMALVRKIDELPRRSRQRAAVFAEMQSSLRQSWGNNPRLNDWARRLEETRIAEMRDVIEFDRELFYAMQPRDRLAEMIERVRDRFNRG